MSIMDTNYPKSQYEFIGCKKRKPCFLSESRGGDSIRTVWQCKHVSAAEAAREHIADVLPK